MEIGKTFCGRTDVRTDTPAFQSTRSSPRRWPKNCTTSQLFILTQYQWRDKCTERLFRYAAVCKTPQCWPAIITISNVSNICTMYSKHYHIVTRSTPSQNRCLGTHEPLSTPGHKTLVLQQTHVVSAVVQAQLHLHFNTFTYNWPCGILYIRKFHIC